MVNPKPTLMDKPMKPDTYEKENMYHGHISEYITHWKSQILSPGISEPYFLVSYVMKILHGASQKINFYSYACSKFIHNYYRIHLILILWHTSRF